MNLPNKLSILRIILIPATLLFMLPINIYGFEPAGWNAFIADHGMLIAAIIFIVASLTDFFDGQIARRKNLITDLGKFLDALADKVLIISILLAFVALGRISAWLVFIIVLREFMVSGIRMIASSKGVVMAAKMIGKVKTTTQMIAIIYMMFEPTLMKIFGFEAHYPLQTCAITVIGDVLFLISVIMTVISGLDYLFKNKNYLTE
ncbi:MAG: CDP-diacylglycerol--glycerol-3-phosphate 3-phosphatidyltransferase [Clostridiales bacterium]|nr:CDP-diacylglycerol--glycerol-3-phosphate 3-phosphatidyltransferase [Clostridiales bacterium]